MGWGLWRRRDGWIGSRAGDEEVGGAGGREFPRRGRFWGSSWAVCIEFVVGLGLTVERLKKWLRVHSHLP